MLKNGFIIKSNENQLNRSTMDPYFVIGRNITWPLDGLSDDVSIELTAEAERRWFGYSDSRPWVIPDVDYLQRYKRHCQFMNISTYCLQVESSSSIILSSAELPIIRILGYDYADVDMSTSCLYEDLTMNVCVVKDIFRPVLRKLNQYRLLNSEDDVQEYLSGRRALINMGYDMEEYFSPLAVKLTEVLL